MVSWGKVVKIALEEAKNYKEQNGIALTLRGLYYILMSKGVIPGTKRAYQTLSRKLARARYEGVFPWDLLRDVTRKSTYLEWTTSYATKPLTAEELKRQLEYYIDTHFDTYVNPWDDQPYKIIVVVEKEALFDSIRKLINELFPFGVYKLVAIKGYDSATNIKELADDLKDISYKGKIPVVLALGDFDPSGEDIPRDARDRLKMLSGVDFIFEKVAVRKEHVLSLGLPPAPESEEEISKLKRDPRYPKYLARLMGDPELKELAERYGGLVRVELDALVALRLDVFKEILKKAIEKYFDYDIYNNITKKKEVELKTQTEEAKRKSFEELRKLLSGTTAIEE